MSFERVTYRPEGATRSRTIYLADVTEGDLLLTGTEVTRTGEQAGTLEVARRVHLIDKSLITRRTACRLNLHYGLLEEDTT